MKVVIVYESLFGTTRAVAEAIGEGIRVVEPDATVECVSVADATQERVEDADLLVVGGPTHMRGMTSSFTRRMGLKSEQKSAETKGTPYHPEEGAEVAPGLRDWLHALPRAPRGSRAAAFDTRADAKMAGGAGPGIGHRLRRHGYDLVDEPQAYKITGTEGPLEEGELERARAWGATLPRQRTR